MTGADEPIPAPSMEKAGRISRLAAPALVLLILAPTLLYPFGRDQSVFAYVGTVIARGGMPYRDAWDVKPPGIYLLYALLASLARDGGWRLMVAVRIADCLAAAVSGSLLASLSRRLRPQDAGAGGVAAAAWFAALYLQGGFWGLAQAETWATPLVLGSALLCLRKPGGGRRRDWMLAGVLAGGAAVLKYTAVLPLLPFLFCAFSASAPRREGLARLAWFGMGALLPGVLAVGWLAAGGAWAPFLEVQRGFVAPYSRLNAGGVGQRAANLVRYTSGWALSVWLPVVLGGVALCRVRDWHPQGRRLAVGWLLAGLVAVWAQNKYFGYHWQTVLPALSVLAAFGSSDAFEWCALPRRWVWAVAAGVVVFWGGIRNWSAYRDGFGRAVGSVSEVEWLQRFRTGADYNFLADTRVADFVRRKTRPGDPVMVWGFEPAVYLLSGRRPATRFFFDVPVGVTFAPSVWKQEFLADLNREPPALFLTVRNDAIPWASGRSEDSVQQLRSWPELAAWLRSGYVPLATIEDFTVYRRRLPASHR